MSCLREVQTISKSPDILPMPSLTRLTTGGVLNPLKNTTNTSHNELLHQEPLQPPLELSKLCWGRRSPLAGGERGANLCDELGRVFEVAPADPDDVPALCFEVPLALALAGERRMNT